MSLEPSVWPPLAVLETQVHFDLPATCCLSLYDYMVPAQPAVLHSPQGCLTPVTSSSAAHLPTFQD